MNSIFFLFFFFYNFFTMYDGIRDPTLSVYNVQGWAKKWEEWIAWPSWRIGNSVKLLILVFIMGRGIRFRYTSLFFLFFCFLHFSGGLSPFQELLTTPTGFSSTIASYARILGKWFVASYEVQNSPRREESSKGTVLITISSK